MHMNRLRRTLLASAISMLAAASATSSAQEAALPPDSQYVTVQDGHLSVDGQRQRYWAVIGKLYASSGVKSSDTPEQREEKVANARKSTDVLLDRFDDLGFNAARLWTGFADSADYTAGDGSSMDDADYFIAEAGKRGMKIWLAGLNRVGDVKPDDVDVIDDPATAQDWSEAVAEMQKKDKSGKVTGGWGLSINIARHWDPRLEALTIQRMTNIATHRNKHNGLRWADDPTFAVWELSNEEWWMRKMVGGQWQKLPAHFKNQLIDRWQQFLRQKYQTDDALAQAWGGLLPGESLQRGTVLLAPMAGATSAAASINDSNPHAQAAVQSLEQDYDRADFQRQRGADVIEFFMGIQLSHKQRLAAALKPLGKSTRLSPWIYDTGIGYEIQSQFLHQNADAVAHDAYVNGTGPQYETAVAKADAAPDEHRRNLAIQDAERISANVVDPTTGDKRWVNWLLKPPGIAQGVPWLEHNRVEGKPYLVYETQIQQPGKYRADFPLRIAALASIQDWDWISWHYFGDGSLDKAGQVERPFERAMDITTGGHPQGYHYTYDEIQNAMMRAAAYLFRQEKLDAPQNPTKFIYGRRSLYDPASMDYAGSYGSAGLDMLYTTYQHGVRIEIDPTREDDQVIGPVVKFADRNTHNPYTPTDQITFDWKKGFLELDSAEGVAWTGLLANHGPTVTFDHAPVALSDVTIVNPEGMYDPVRDDEKYIAFSLYSTDGKPLAEAKNASLSLVSTSYNTGFALAHGSGETKKPNQAGELPVLVARVGATVESPAIDGMTYTLRDWNMNEIGTGKVTGGKLKIPADKPVFVVELSRE